MTEQGLGCAVALAAGLGFSLLCACASTTPAAKEKPWKTMDRATLDASYNNSKAVPESAAMFKEWQARSAQVRASHPEHLDVAYGPRERNKIDYFSAGQDTPVLIFIHGGF